MRWLVVDIASNAIENIVLWDGNTNYHPGEGKDLRADYPGASIGDLYSPPGV